MQIRTIDRGVIVKDYSRPDEIAFLPFEVEDMDLKKGDDGSSSVGTFRGLASAYNNEDLVGDIIKPGAFGSINPKKIKMLWQHRSDQPVGVWTEFKDTSKGLEAHGTLVLEVQRAAEAHALMKAGAVDGLSIGFRIPPKGATFDDTTGKRIITKIDLWEVSLVTFPANPKARIASVKGSDMTVREFENFLRDEGGFSIDQAKRITSSGYHPDQAARDEADEGMKRLSDALKKRSGIWSH